MVRKHSVPPPTKPVIACSPAWAWFFAGILIGIVISFVFYLREIAPHQIPTPTENNTSPTIVAAASNNASEKNATPDKTVPENANRFEFYDILSNEGAKKITGTASSDLGAIDLSPVQTPGTYLLQIGSFKDARGAEELQTYLSTLNMRAYVQQATAKETDGTTVLWHRVMAGPFTDLNLLNQARTTLATQNIPSIVLNVTN